MITRLAAGLVVAVLLSFSGVAGVVAQDATPAASPVAVPEELPITLIPWVVTDEMRPTAAQCTIEPVDVVALGDALIAAEPRPAPIVTDNLLVAIPALGPADQATIDGVLATLTQFWACNNAGNRPAMVASFTPLGTADLYGLDLSAADEDLRAAVEGALVPGDPRSEGEISGIDGIISIVALNDGRTAALVLNTDPRIAGGDQVLDLIIFIEQDGRYLVDEFVGDPFDQTPGYGIEN
jgi:hypothetical protein